MKYKIYLDSNQVFTGKKPLTEPFNFNIRDLRIFLEDNGLTDIDICLPEIVVRERIQHRLEDINKEISIANEAIRALQTASHKLKEIKPRTDYRKTLEKNADLFLKKYKVKRIGLPKIGEKELIDRAINKMKPFGEGGVGFKDTLIFLSMVGDALDSSTSADRYLFCTGDAKEFTEEVIAEFQEVTGKELHLLPSIVKVSEKLDELVPLNLHLAERNRKIKEVILKKIGDLMVEVNKTLTDSSGPISRYGGFALRPAYDYAASVVNTYASVYSDGSQTDADSEIVGFNFDELEFDSFNDLNSDKYRVSVSLRASIKYKDENSSPSLSYGDSFYVPPIVNRLSYPINYRYASRPNSKTFSIEVTCDLNNGDVGILSVRPLTVEIRWGRST